ncbi:phytanoyl-CoA dioxygenase family protein [Steroidobacter flavus]|uniref:Phytanoyl-CoA dioxygenase family protein n=1 Tax=Steroidobacter flavus TaxID=1842136 RepID=A0ABV8SU68_9GAMM
MRSQLDHVGFAVVEGVIERSHAEMLAHDIDAQLPDVPAAGFRGLTQLVPSVRTLAQSPELRALVETGLSANARLVRSIYFNKSQETNWQVAWHQDLAIAVQRRVEIQGFVTWSSKDGVPHVQPPAHILDRMLTVRLHLDPADESNGALWVVPESHCLGRLPAGDAAGVAERMGKHLCAVNIGDAMLFKPLLLHASRKATSSQARRVIHLEFADVELPAPLQWSEVA